MLIASYNPAYVGDFLMTMIAPDVLEQASERQGNVVRIYDQKSSQTIGYNFLTVSEMLPDLTGQGQVTLTSDQVAKLNEVLAQAGFTPELEVDETPKFVVGYVKEVTDHPDSDHLHITQTEIDNGEVLQIVCGAPNIAQGQKVVVAKVGAMMPTGAMIWPGKLRGIESPGMICSARELHLANAPQVRGILALPMDDARFEVGQAFDFAAGSTLFTND